jgi:hypothetical protein
VAGLQSPDRAHLMLIAEYAIVTSKDNSARKRGQVGPYVKTTRTVLLFYNIVQYLYVYNIIIYLFI